MQKNAEGLGLGLGINLIEKETPGVEGVDVEKFLPHEFKEREYEILGNGKSSFAVLSKPLKETKLAKSEYFPDMEMEDQKTSFLIAGVNEETKKLDEFLLVFEQLKTGNVVFTDPRPLEAWTKLLETKDSKERKSSLYKTNNGYSLLSFGEWIVKQENKYKVSGVGISNSNSVYLKNADQENYNRILRINEIKKAA